MSNIRYRPDIDGLRAIAVLSVVFYHYEIGSLGGGFVGVDVFFVISGYLITGIVQSEMEDGRFTLANFYERRARRIFPALFAMLLTTLVAALFVLLPSDLALLGKSVVATVLFVSNMLYLRQSSYFGAGSDFNPLLHTWSLGVEEQFYVFLPIFLLLLNRYFRHWLPAVLVCSALFSFVLCATLQSVEPKWTFFFSPFRAWELLAGSLLALGVVPTITSSVARSSLAFAALACLCWAVVGTREGIEFPGWQAAVPVLATVLLIHTGAGGGSVISRLLAWRPLVGVGLVSYSLYLWHWPLLVLTKYRGGMESLSAIQSLMLLPIALALAIASYYWIERPFRRRKAKDRSLRPMKVLSATAIAAALLVVLGLGFTATAGIPQRVPDEVAVLDRQRRPVIPFIECDGKLPGQSGQNCRIGEKIEPTRRALVWGDSHALAWAPGLARSLLEDGWQGILAVRSECAPLLGVRNPDTPDCLQHNDSVIEWVKVNKPARVYLVAAWGTYSNADSGYDLSDIEGRLGNDKVFGPAYRRTIEQLRHYVDDIVVLGPTPVAARSVPFALAIVAWHDSAEPKLFDHKKYVDETRNFWSQVAWSADQVQLEDPDNWFCPDGKCLYVVQGKLLFRDAHHLNVEGALFAARHLGLKSYTQRQAMVKER